MVLRGLLLFFFKGLQVYKSKERRLGNIVSAPLDKAQENVKCVKMAFYMAKTLSDYEAHYIGGL